MREILLSFAAIPAMPVIPRIRARMQGDCVAPTVLALFGTFTQRFRAGLSCAEPPALISGVAELRHD